MARRGENIRKRNDGRWEGRYSVIRNGDKKIYSVYAKSYAEVKARLAEAKEKSRNDNCNLFSGTDSISFGTVFEKWLFYIKENRKASTYVKYYSLCKNHLINLSNYPFCEISENITEELIPTLRKGASDNLKKSLYLCMNQIIKFGNATYHMNVPLLTFHTSAGRRPIEIFSLSEQALLLNYLNQQPDNYKNGILLCISTGLRLGEVCALKWEDIDFNHQLLKVNATVQRISVEGKKTKTELVEGAPKSLSSIREIPLPDFVIQIIKEIPVEGSYVIKGNRPAEPRTYEKKLASYLKINNIEHKNFHALRHTFATNCIESGMDVKSLSEILGHADVQTTLNRYVHPTLEMKRQHMANLSAIYGTIMGQNL